MAGRTWIYQNGQWVLQPFEPKKPTGTTVPATPTTSFGGPESGGSAAEELAKIREWLLARGGL